MQVGYENVRFSTNTLLTGGVSGVVNKFQPWSMLITARIDFIYVIRRSRRRERNATVRIGKSEADVTNTKRPTMRLRSMYCTVETNYR